MQKFRKTLSLLVSLGLAASFMVVPPANAASSGLQENPPQTAAPQPQQMIVKFKNKAPQIKNYRVDQSSVGGDHSLISVDIPKGKTVTTAIKEMKSRKDVEYAEPDYQVRLNSTPNDPLYSQQWYHQVIHTEKAWKVTKGSANTVIAVIDDGVDLNHPDLKNQIVAPYDVITKSDTTIPDGEHGTHVAGIIGATADNGIGGSGIAPDVKIMPINVFSTDSSGEEVADTSDVISGIEYAIVHGAKIISMSLGEYDNSQAFDDEIQKAYQAGILVVAAAGNEHTSAPSYPAAYDNVISVASTNENDRISYFSNYGSSIDLAAPGNHILSTLPNDSFGYMSGTSMAAPVVSGVAALVWSKNPALTNAQVADDLFKSADDLGAAGKDTTFGWGRIDAAKALGVKTLSQPTVNPLTDKDTVISGKVAPDIEKGTVVISSDKGELGRATVDSNLNFSLTIPAQTAGTKLTVQVLDDQNNQSDPEVIVVNPSDSLAAPTVDPVSDRSMFVTGTTAPNVKVTVKNGRHTYRGWSNADGQFKVYIHRPAAGTTLEIFATDRLGNKGQAAKVVVIDKTAPARPQVKPMGTEDTVVTGRAEANSQITVLSGSALLGTAIADQSGHFTVTIPKQSANTQLTVVATDAAKNQSKPATIIVRDRTARTTPRIPDSFMDSFYFSQWFQAFIGMISR